MTRGHADPLLPGMQRKKSTLRGAGLCGHGPDHHEPTLFNEDNESLRYCRRCGHVVERKENGVWIVVGGITKASYVR